jgi:large subunit ribosomal protein L4e
MCSAIAATGVPALVMAKGHQIDTIKEVPFVVADKLQAFQKTKEAVCFLRMSRAWADVAKVSVSCFYIIQCCGSRSTCFWASRILIRIQ